MQDTADRAIAIVGVGALMPDAPNAAAFWDNIKAGRYSISEVTPDRWDPAVYYDPDHNAPDKTYSKIGGWVRESVWEPLKWRLAIPPKVIEAMDEAQRWAIACTRDALADYGYPERPLNSERTAVILGNAMAGEKHYFTAMRAHFPEYARELDETASFAALPAALRRDIAREWRARIGDRLPPITEDTMPGELSNCLAGRIANIFNFHGPNYVCDAACASGMAAIHAVTEGLAAHDFDVAVTGGVDRNMGASTFVKFCKIGALSGTGSRPYAEGADGFVMGEGAAIFLMKRLADAERAGDRIYAVLRGVGGSSDGKGKGITAPNPIGQKIAIERAWENAGLSPATATLLEGHGTSTSVGDSVEVQSMAEVLKQHGANGRPIALGSVKSNIGHLKSGAGAAGVLKAALALRYKVLPPSARCEHPNPNIDWAHTPLYVNTELRPWTETAEGVRRAGVSAFGFGGTNFHIVLEEYIPHRLTGNGKHAAAQSRTPQDSGTAPAGAQPSAPAKAPLRGALLAGAASEPELAEQLRAIEASAKAGHAPPPCAPRAADLHAQERLAIDYGSAAELAEKCAKALKAIESRQPAAWKALRAQGIFRGHGPAAKVAFLYTGQGSQYPNMLRNLRDMEPIVARTFGEADAIMTPILGKPLSDYIFVDAANRAAMARAEEDLRQTAITQPAVLATDLALTRLLEAYGIRPDMTMGHSLGEYGALGAAGALPFADALEAVAARGREMTRVSMADNGRMAAVFAPLAEIERILKTIPGYVVVANLNSDKQAVIGGESAAVDLAVAAFLNAGYNAVPLQVSHAFHTSIVAAASAPLREVLERLRLQPPQLPIVANVDGEFYPMGEDARPAMLDILARQVAAPVQFIKGLRTLYEAGVRVFVEAGPKKALHGFAEEVLGEYSDVLALFTNHPKFADEVAFNQALCGLYSAGLGAGCAETQPDTLAIGAEQRPTARPIAITGASLGLPGTGRIFDDSNVARILRGEQFIDAIPMRFRRAMLDKNITRLVKSDNGGAVFEPIRHPGEVIKLAARGGAFDLNLEFGISPERIAALDRVTSLAIAAGVDALRDAGIPLTMRYKTTTTGAQLPERWGLPDALRDETGVIFASVFPGFDSFADYLASYHADRSRRDQLATLEDLRDRAKGQPELRQEMDRRIVELQETIAREPFQFDRRFLFRVLSMGHSQFAELIGARGPNTQINSACASTTQAISLAQDWIRAGRCRRVIVISADDVTSDHLLEWFGAGFLASGAAATDELVEEAAVPFDRRRHGLIIGMGAAALVLESADAASERGLQPICEVLSTVTSNSAYHGTRLDDSHIQQTMEQLVQQAETAGGMRRERIAPHTVFVSHETYTPARGGSASAEIRALRAVFGASAEQIVIANTKGFTGHAMGTGIEDVVAVKALETGCVPPVANFKEVDPELGKLNLSKGGAYPVEYALRLGAGFGSQISMTLLRRVGTAGARPAAHALGYGYRISDPAAWQNWLDRIAGHPAELEVAQRTLRVRNGSLASGSQPAQAISVPAAGIPVLKTTPPPHAPAVSAPAPAPAPAAEPAGDLVRERIIELVVEKTGYPKDMLDLDLDLEADLGVDTVKQAEMFASIREIYHIARDPNLKLRDFPTLARVIQFVYDHRPDLKAAAPVPAAAATSETQAAPNEDAVRQKVLDLFVAKTGYPREMLDLDLDLEADLGIDTVKQAELFASMREIYNIPRDPNLKLRDFPTLERVIQFVYDHRPDLKAAPPVSVGGAPPETEAPAAEDPVRQKVLDLFAEKTGYPKDMLDPYLDLEADLGIDTVKQAELFASIRELYSIPRDPNLKLRDFPTLAHVIRFAAERRVTEEPLRELAAFDAADAIPRRVPIPVLRPPLTVCKPTGVTLEGGRRIFLMPDRNGVAEALADKLRAMGVDVVENAGMLDTAPIHGVYWLAALDDEGELETMTPEGWREALDVRVKSFYRTMRALYDQVALSGTFLVCATRLGGQHGYGETGATAPLGGAVTGFTKAYKRERPDVLAKAVDFETTASAADIAGALIEETLRDPGAVEIGYQGAHRWTIALEESPAADGGAAMTLDKDSVFLITGAAGSIVSAITADLAAASGGTFHLLDLVPEPDAANPDIARFTADKEGLKREIAARMQARGERATPARVEKELAALERAHAARAAIDAVRAAGGVAHYHSVNLTDGEAVAKIIEGVRQTSGRIDVLLHAAGTDRSHLLKDKDPREFDLVFDVKSDGLFHLLHAIGDMPLRALIGFSSIAGRFGNGGQTDYSGANDLMCKIVSSLRRTRPATRAIAIDWTAWGGIGMASRGSIPKMMAMAGIDMLPPEAGVPWIRRELTTGGGAGEIVVAGRLGALLKDWDDTGGLIASLPGGPMLATARMELDGRLTVETTLDPAVQPFLNHHRIEGTAVLPGVMGIEGFAEAALSIAPGWRVEAIEDIDFLAPFKFYRGEPRSVTIEARFAVQGDGLAANCRLAGHRVLANQAEARTEIYFTGRVRLAAQVREPAERLVFDKPHGSLIAAEDIYRVYFHGPAYRVLKRAWWDEKGAIGEIATDLPDDHQPADRPLAIAPRLIELCFQTAGLFEMAVEQRMGLPRHVDRVSFYRSPEATSGPLFAVVSPDPATGGFNADVVDQAGTRYLHVGGYRTVTFRDNLDARMFRAAQVMTA